VSAEETKRAEKRDQAFDGKNPPLRNEREGWGTLEFIRGTVLEAKRKAHASEGGRYKGVRADG